MVRAGGVPGPKAENGHKYRTRRAGVKVRARGSFRGMARIRTPFVMTMVLPLTEDAEAGRSERANGVSMVDTGDSQH